MSGSIRGGSGVLSMHRSLHLAKGRRHAIAHSFPEATSRGGCHSLRRSAGTGGRAGRHSLPAVPDAPGDRLRGQPGFGTVTPIRTATNTALTAIKVGITPVAIAITPSGKTAYVADTPLNAVTPFFTATGTAGKPIGAGEDPEVIAVTPAPGGLPPVGRGRPPAPESARCPCPLRPWRGHRLRSRRPSMCSRPRVQTRPGPDRARRAEGVPLKYVREVLTSRRWVPGCARRGRGRAVRSRSGASCRAG